MGRHQRLRAIPAPVEVQRESTPISPKYDPDQMRRDAADLLAKADALKRRARMLQRMARIAELSAEDRQQGDSVRTMGDMDTARTEQSGKGSGRPIQSDHPFPRALARSGITIAEWARRHHVSPEVVRSWYAAQPHQQRRIPRRMAEAIAAEFGLPADESTWPQGLK